MAEKLTPQQAQAVQDRGGKLLVSAAAGSGKTKVLVDRLMGYLTDPIDPANIDEFLIITYTKAAASELRGKIAAKLSERIALEPENRHLQQQLQRLYMTTISTVHAFCGDILRQFAYRLDLSADFRVADENECRQLRDGAMEQILEEAYDHAGEDEEFCAFVDTQGIGRDDRQVPEILLKVYDSARCHLDPEGWLDRCVKAVEAEDGESVWQRYLMDELFSYLDLQIDAMERCATLAASADEMEKPAVILRDTVNQLRHLRESTTWDQVVARRNIDYGTLRFSKKCTDTDLIDGIKAVRNGCKKGLERMLRSFTDPSVQVLADLRSSADAVRGMVKLVRRFGEVYDKGKQRRRVLDFGDLEHRTLDLLLGKSRSAPTAVAHEIGARFREVMVDEYQDSNAVQDAIYGALTVKRQNCFMVGDVKQSIYQFRLADPGIFLEKYASFVPAAEAKTGDGRKVVLSRNFRSCGAVLAATNCVFETCMSPAVGGLYYGADEALYEGIPHEPLAEPEVELYAIPVQEDTYAEEAAFVAQRISELICGEHYIRDKSGQRRIKPEDIVILLRSPGSVGEQYRMALERKGIRCTTGGGCDLLQTEEIGVLRSLLQTIQNPQLDIPLAAVLASPVFEFTADDLAEFRGKNKKCSVYDAIYRDESVKCKEFVAFLQKLRKESRMRCLTELLETIFVETRLDSIYRAMDPEKAENLQTFYQLAADFEAGGQRDLGRFLEHLDAMEDKGLIVGAEQSGTGAVTIMSIHKSKGLEFPVVFLSGLGREFNRESQRAQVLCHKELGIGIAAADAVRRVRYPTVAKRAISTRIGAESVSEELRVLYVAMTRAKDRLIMTYASRSLEAELQDMVARMNMGCKELLTREAGCPGEWVLLAALTRIEAGELFNLGGKPTDVKMPEYPWLIRVENAPMEEAFVAQKEEKTAFPEEMLIILRRNLSFSYTHKEATRAPSKQTATQRKGRLKDQEAAENTPEPKPIHRTWRKPAFIEQTVRGTDYGTAIHTLLQFIDYAACGDAAGVQKEVNRLVEDGILTEQMGQMVPVEQIAAFFETELGKRIRFGKEVLREFKFSILDKGEAYGDGLEGEEILLQGVVDCAIVEADGLTIVDFKTDRVTEQNIDTAVAGYKPQVDAYADAMSRIFSLPVKEKSLYFFRLEKLLVL